MRQQASIGGRGLGTFLLRFLPLRASQAARPESIGRVVPERSSPRHERNAPRWQRFTQGQGVRGPLRLRSRSRSVPGPGSGVSGPASRAAESAEARRIARTCSGVSSPSRRIRSRSSVSNPPSGPLVSRRSARRSQWARSQATIATPAKNPSHGSVSEASESAAGGAAKADCRRRLPISATDVNRHFPARFLTDSFHSSSETSVTSALSMIRSIAFCSRISMAIAPRRLLRASSARS